LPRGERFKASAAAQHGILRWRALRFLRASACHALSDRSNARMLRPAGSRQPAIGGVVNPPVPAVLLIAILGTLTTFELRIVPAGRPHSHCAMRGQGEPRRARRCRTRAAAPHTLAADPEPAGAPSPPGTFRPLRARRPPAPSAARALEQPGDQVEMLVLGLLGETLDPRLMAGLLVVIALDLPSVVARLDRLE